MNLIGKLRREKEFRQQYCRNSTKMRREKKKKGERESRGISATLLPKFLYPKCCRSVKKKAMAVMPLPKNEKKKNLFWQLWQCHCRKWKKKIMKSVNE